MARLMVAPGDSAIIVRVKDRNGHSYSDVSVRRPRFYGARVVDAVWDTAARNLFGRGWTAYDGPIDETIPYMLTEDDEVDYIGAFNRIADRIPIEVLQEAIDNRASSDDIVISLDSVDVPHAISPDNHTGVELMNVINKLNPEVTGRGYSKARLVELICDELSKRRIPTTEEEFNNILNS